MNVAIVFTRWFVFRASMCRLIMMIFPCRSKLLHFPTRGYRYIFLTMRICLKGNTFLLMRMKNGMTLMIFVLFSFVKVLLKPLKNLDGLRILFIAVAG